MASDVNSGIHESNRGGSDHQRPERTGQPTEQTADRSADQKGTRAEDWRRVETEQVERAELGRKHDATHEPSPEFEQAARPPGGREQRPERREVDDLTPEQRAEIEEFTGQSAEHVVQRRNQAHASYLETQQERPTVELRDDLPTDHTYNTLVRSYQNGSISHDTLSRYLDNLDLPEPPAHETTEHTDQQQRERTTTGDRASQDTAETVENAGQEQAGHTLTDHPPGNAADSATEPDQAGTSDLPDRARSELTDPPRSELGNVVEELRTGQLTPSQAADRLEALHADQQRTPRDEATTETVRTEHTSDGRVLHYQRGTPEGIDDQPGERTATEESDKTSERDRNRRTLIEGTSNVLQDVNNIASNAEKGLPPRLPPGTHGETGVRQPDTPAIGPRQSEQLDAGNIVAGTLATTVAAIVIWRKFKE